MGMDHGIGKIAKLSRVSKPSFSSRISLHRCEHIYIYIYGRGSLGATVLQQVETTTFKTVGHSCLLQESSSNKVDEQSTEHT
jgi:hypothetical protein